MSCPILERAHEYSPEKLIKTAFKFLPLSTLQSTVGTLHPTQHRVLEQQRRRKIDLHHLADTLHYHQGVQISRHSRWNEMTRLQMQHELEKGGKLEEGEEKTLSEWKLRIRLVGIVMKEREAWKKDVQAMKEKDKEVEARLEKKREIEAKRAWAAQCRADDEIDNDQSEVTTSVPEQAGRRQTRSTRVVQEPEDEDMEDAEEDIEDEEDSEDDDGFVVDDGYKRVRKPKISVKVVSKPFAAY